jgi:hypothetical protein
VDKRIEGMVANLAKLGRYSRLLNYIVDPVPQSFLFELLFANTLETNGIELTYEVNIRSGTNSTVDFVYDKNDGTRLCFELLSPEMSNELKREAAPVQTEFEGVKTWSARMGSGYENPYLRPESLTIRMQEKLLEKIDKFSEPTDSIYSIIVVDCSDFHFGHFDEEDCRMVLFGRTQNPYFQEYWNERPIIGILNPNNDRRGAVEFRERISAVMFIPQKDIQLLDNAFILLNASRSESHLQALCLKMKGIPILGKLNFVHPPYKLNHSRKA